MQCGYPINVKGKPLPCGRCMNCRINKKRTWTGRLKLELAYAVTESVFVTLTYDDAQRPGELVPADLKKFVDRCRNSSLGAFRYFAVGEYGDKSEREHFHLLMFGVSGQWEEYIRDRWESGFVTVLPAEPAAAGYIAGYCTKKMTVRTDERLDGRHPEFARMSKTPPIGAAGFDKILRAYQEAGRQGYPTCYRMEGKVYQIPEYFKTRWKELYGENQTVIEPVEADWLYQKALREKAQAKADQEFSKRRFNSRTL